MLSALKTDLVLCSRVRPRPFLHPPARPLGTNRFRGENAKEMRPGGKRVGNASERGENKDKSHDINFIHAY